MGGVGALNVLNTFSAREKYDILVIRISNGNIVESSPCLMCVNFMKLYNIRRVYFSNDNGQISYMKVSEIEGEPTGTTKRLLSIMPLRTKSILSLY